MKFLLLFCIMFFTFIIPLIVNADTSHKRKISIFGKRIEHDKNDKKASQAQNGEFTYEDPNVEWPHEYKTCAGRRQSPIDLNPHYFVDANLPPLEFVGYDNLPLSLKIVNSGHSAQLSGKWVENGAPVIFGGPLRSIYEFAQLHFHWGENNDVGSEHTILGERLPLELHVVHWNRAYGNMTEATKHSDGLAVLGYLIDVDEYYYRNIGIERIIASFPNIIQPNQETELEPFPLDAFNLDMIRGEYLTYPGSLTTPPCSEAVTWLVAVNNLPGVSNRELNSFRHLQLNHRDQHNYRPTQPLNGRKVYYIQAY